MSTDHLLICSMLDSYKELFPIIPHYETIKHLIESYKSSGLYNETVNRQKNRISLTKYIIEDFSSSTFFKHAVKYDLFRRLRLTLNEDEISNITADIMDPKKSPFGKIILAQILKKTDKDWIAKIVQQTDENRIEVKREQSGVNSRIDLRVHTNNFSGENAVIGFEFKMGQGSETFINETYQTEREWGDLTDFAGEKKIKPRNIVAYFVTPHGARAKYKKFDSLSRYDLNEIISEVLNNFSGKSDKIDIDGIGTLKHFFNSRWVF